MNDSEVEKDSGEFTRESPLKKMMRALTILSQLPSIDDFYYFFREKSMLHTSYEKILQPWVYPYSFPDKREAFYKILIKPCVRNLIQHCSVEKHKA